MNASVLHQPLQRDAGDLAPNGIETGEDHRFRRVVDDEIDAGGQLQSADVAPFAADDASLHIFGRQIDDRDRVFGDVIGGHPLHGHAEDLAGFLIAELDRFRLDPLDDLRGLELRFILHAANQLLLRLFDGETGNLLELVPLLLDERVQLRLP